MANPERLSQKPERWRSHVCLILQEAAEYVRLLRPIRDALVEYLWKNPGVPFDLSGAR
jgi:hypothetical protein